MPNNPETKRADWTKPDDNGIIRIPDELDPLVNSVATQLKFHKHSGVNENLTIARIVRKAEEFFQQKVDMKQRRIDELEKYIASKVEDYPC